MAWEACRPRPLPLLIVVVCLSLCVLLRCVPHSYVEAFLITGDPVLEEVARDTIHYLTTDMMTSSQDGSSVGFYSAESAESPPPAAREGAFYVWTKEEVVEALGKADAEHWCALLGVKEGGNVPPNEDPHGELEGQNVLFLTKPLAELSSDDKRVLEAGRQALTRARTGRPRPERVRAGWGERGRDGKQRLPGHADS